MSPLNDEDERALIEIARRSIEDAVRGSSPRPLSGVPEVLAEKAGAFVTLRAHGFLRGCIGHVEANRSMAETVADCAAAAALHDPRFPPVTSAELQDLSIDISVLSPLFDIQPPNIEIGRHGLLISSGFRRGLLLPEVPVEWDWNVERFLDETCAKAGLPVGAWRRGARIQAFTTHVIASPDAQKAGAESAV